MSAVYNDSQLPGSWSAPTRRAGVKQLYFALAGERGDDIGRVDELTRSASRAFLAGQLDRAAALDSDFPDDPRALSAWLAQANARAAQGYRDYLDARQQGAPRRFFSSRAHALYFLKSVAPTKLVDGAWLYGVLPRWADSRLAPLVRIYLEELGDGVTAQNHVLLYRQLLARHGIDQWQQQPDDRFVQGAVQLSLAHHAADFLPEIIGFNLGYEQLPLHLPITSYELNELDIDPYYFSLHVTIDNAANGHAQKSLQAALDAVPAVGDPAAFHRRVANGFRLNDVGMGTTDAIASFDLERELLAVLRDKAVVGAQLHSDYCRVGGRTVSDWLTEPRQLPAFLQTLQDTGWIRRGQDPAQSRFWRLLTDAQAPMFGVFSGYEQQLLRDWIVDDRSAGRADPASPRRPAINRFRRRPDAGDAPCVATALQLPAQASVAEIVAHHLRDLLADDAARGDHELRALAERLGGATQKADALKALQGFLSPANHASPAGLAATRLYAQLFAC